MTTRTARSYTANGAQRQPPAFAADRPEVWDQLRDRRNGRSRISLNISALAGRDGGRGGIRTPDAREGMPHFECGAFNRSATLPRLPLVEKRAETSEGAAMPQASRVGRRAR